MSSVSDMARLIFAVADDALRGPYRPNEYGKVVLPMTVLRRLDCVLADTKAGVLAAAEKHAERPEAAREALLNRAAGRQFHNASHYTFPKLVDDPANVAANLRAFVAGFSGKARDVLEHFKLDEQVARLDQRDRLYRVVKQFAALDLHPDRVPNEKMGELFEALVRKYNEDANDTAGDHFTPREVIRLMVNLVLGPDSDTLTQKGALRTLYDPTCGTGGMLAAAEDYLRELNPDASLEVFGQDYNPESYAVCGSDMLIKGHDVSHIAFGDTLGDGHTADAFPGRRFDYMLANPPFGVKWEAQKDAVTKEHAGRRRPLRRRAAGGQEGRAAVPAAHDLQDEAARGRRHAPRHRLQRRPALRRRRRRRRERHPPLDCRERLAGKRSSPCPTSSSTARASSPISGC